MAKVMLVDDYPPLLRHYAAWLAQHCEVITAQSADEALRLLDRDPCDIVITDHRMPGHTGIWLLERIRRDHDQISRVLMSVEPPRDIDSHLSSGLVHHFLAKPFADEALLDCLNAAAVDLHVGHPDPRGGPSPKPTPLTAAALRELLTPEHLRPVYQPIFTIAEQSYHLHALEGLIRGPLGSPVEGAEALFTGVREHGLEAQADEACIATLLRGCRELPGHWKLSLNVHASTLTADLDFAARLLAGAEAVSLSPRRLIIEIVEYAPEWVGAEFLVATQRLRDAGACIAVDDVGSGQSNYRKVLDCQPEYIKIDRYFVTSCHEDFRRQAVLESIALLAPRFGSRVVAEGVESPAELERVTRIGIDLVQGFLLARPTSAADLAAAPFLDGEAIPLSNIHHAVVPATKEKRS